MSFFILAFLFWALYTHERLFAAPLACVAMTPSARNSPNALRMLQRLPIGIRQTFSPAQVQALEDALMPRTHAIDIRCLMPPFLGRGAYFVFSAGPNRRSRRRTADQQFGSHVPGLLSNVITMSQSCQNCPNAYRLLQRIPKDVCATFTVAQVQAIETALVPRRHVIDIRLAMPFLGKGAYLVFAAGPNKRAHYRDIQNRNPFVMPAVVASVVVGAASILGLVHLKGSELLEAKDPRFVKETFHPTAVPFKKNRGECEESGRQWIDNQCIDRVHDPVF